MKKKLARFMHGRQLKKKAMSKQRKCRICKEPYIQWNSLSKTCGKYECNVKFVEQHVNKAQASRTKLQRAQTRADKERLKPRSKWLQEAQNVFNQFIRLRDKDLPCISCGRFHCGQYHCGHYRSVGACGELRFEESNCHKQCAPCNNHLSGNVVEYRIGLIKKIGIEKVEWLEGPHEPKKYTIDELRELKALYKRKLKELSK